MDLNSDCKTMIDYNILIIIKDVTKIAITNKLMIKCFETQFLLKVAITVYFTLFSKILNKHYCNVFCRWIKDL